MNSGASTMPTKIFAAVETPTAPPTLSVRSSSQEKPCTSGGRMRQWNRSVVNTLITSTIGKACSASTEGGAGPACGGDRIDRIVDRREHARGARDLEQDDRGDERHQQRDRGLPPRYAAAVFADDPGKGEQGEDAECRLEICH